MTTENETQTATTPDGAAVHTMMLVGMEALPVRVDVTITRGMPSFDIVGLPEASARETRVRVRSALDQFGFDFPSLKRVTVELAPSDVRRYGAGFDLAIAAAILAAQGACPTPQGWVLIGELSLTGAIRPVRGVLPQVLAAGKRGFQSAVVPVGNAEEASVASVDGLDVWVASDLRSVVDCFLGKTQLTRAEASPIPSAPSYAFDLADISGQPAAKRALEIAAAGGHNVLFIGPPGAGKTVLARTLVGILPPMTFDEAVEATSIHSVAGLLPPKTSLAGERPFRAPHHTASTVGIFGGGDPPRPGEVSLAHNGVLFLDELPEFSREVLESLKEPIQERSTTIVRGGSRTTFPAKFQLIAAMNPCSCGYYGDPSGRCGCSDERVKRYISRIVKLDYFDMHVVLPPVRMAQAGEPVRGPTSSEVRERVTRAKEWRRSTRGESGTDETRPSALRATCSPDAHKLLVDATEKLELSTAAVNRVLRIARTIANLDTDIDGRKVDTAITAPHIAEAVEYRQPW